MGALARRAATGVALIVDRAPDGTPLHAPRGELRPRPTAAPSSATCAGVGFVCSAPRTFRKPTG